jgi:C_GCAxxG_C_C family probable redox protein
MTDHSMKPAEEAEGKFRKGFNCSQAVFSTFAEQAGVAESAALKIAAPFGGGLARGGEVCGAVSGALMAIGLHRASEQLELATKEKTYALAQEFMTQFKARHGSIICRDLLGCDFATPEGAARIKEGKLTSTICPPLVRDAAETVAAVLELP